MHRSFQAKDQDMKQHQLHIILEGNQVHLAFHRMPDAPQVVPVIPVFAGRVQKWIWMRIAQKAQLQLIKLLSEDTQPSRGKV
jgi:hypothetical protein